MQRTPAVLKTSVMSASRSKRSMLSPLSPAVFSSVVIAVVLTFAGLVVLTVYLGQGNRLGPCHDGTCSLACHDEDCSNQYSEGTGVARLTTSAAINPLTGAGGIRFQFDRAPGAVSYYDLEIIDRASGDIIHTEMYLNVPRPPLRSEDFGYHLAMLTEGNSPQFDFTLYVWIPSASSFSAQTELSGRVHVTYENEAFIFGTETPSTSDIGTLNLPCATVPQCNIDGTNPSTRTCDFVSNTCRPPKENTKICSENTDCVSGICRSSHTCGEAPAGDQNGNFLVPLSLASPPTLVTETFAVPFLTPPRISFTSGTNELEANIISLETSEVTNSGFSVSVSSGYLVNELTNQGLGVIPFGKPEVLYSEDHVYIFAGSERDFPRTSFSEVKTACRLIDDVSIEAPFSSVTHGPGTSFSSIHAMSASDHKMRSAYIRENAVSFDALYLVGAMNLVGVTHTEFAFTVYTMSGPPVNKVLMLPGTTVLSNPAMAVTSLPTMISPISPGTLLMIFALDGGNNPTLFQFHLDQMWSTPGPTVYASTTQPVENMLIVKHAVSNQTDLLVYSKTGAANTLYTCMRAPIHTMFDVVNENITGLSFQLHGPPVGTFDDQSTSIAYLAAVENSGVHTVVHSMSMNASSGTLINTGSLDLSTTDNRIGDVIVEGCSVFGGILYVVFTARYTGIEPREFVGILKLNKSNQSAGATVNLIYDVESKGSRLRASISTNQDKNNIAIHWSNSGSFMNADCGFMEIRASPSEINWTAWEQF